MNQTYAIGSAQLAREPAAPMHAIPSAMEKLGMAINGLAATADNLSSRLGRVTMPSPGHTGTDANGLRGVSAPTSPMAVDLEGERQRIENITAGLQDVLNRLEV